MKKTAAKRADAAASNLARVIALVRALDDECRSLLGLAAGLDELQPNAENDELLEDVRYLVRTLNYVGNLENDACVRARRLAERITVEVTEGEGEGD